MGVVRHKCNRNKNKEGKISHIVGFPRGVTNGAENYYKATFPSGKIYYKAIYTGKGGGYHMAIFPREMAREKVKYYS